MTFDEGIQMSNSSNTEVRTRIASDDSQPLDGMENPHFEPLLDSEEAAALLKIHPKTLQKLARNGGVDAIRIGKLWRFRASALNRWLEQMAR